MSYQAYLDNIKAKTGKSPGDFRRLAGEKGLSERVRIMAWLKQEFGLGYGHAHLIAHLVLHHGEDEATPEQNLSRLFSGKKAHWRAAYDGLAGKVLKYGKDVRLQANGTYVSLNRGNRKFGILQPSSAGRLDIGIKLKGLKAGGRLEAAGSWNAMVTHRVRVGDPKQVDSEILGWLKKAYEAS